MNKKCIDCKFAQFNFIDNNLYCTFNTDVPNLDEKRLYDAFLDENNKPISKAEYLKLAKEYWLCLGGSTYYLDSYLSENEKIYDVALVLYNYWQTNNNQITPDYFCEHFVIDN